MRKIFCLAALAAVIAVGARGRHPLNGLSRSSTSRPEILSPDEKTSLHDAPASSTFGEYSLKVQCRWTGDMSRCGSNPYMIACGKDGQGLNRIFYTDFDKAFAEKAITDLSGKILSKKDDLSVDGQKQDFKIDMTKVSISGDPECSSEETRADQPCRTASDEIVVPNTAKPSCGRTGDVENLSAYQGPEKVCKLLATCRDNSNDGQPWEQLVACEASGDSCPPLYECLLNKHFLVTREEKSSLDLKGFTDSAGSGLAGLISAKSDGSGVIVRNRDEKSSDGLCLTKQGAIDTGADGGCKSMDIMRADSCINPKRVSPKDYPNASGNVYADSNPNP